MKKFMQSTIPLVGPLKIGGMSASAIIMWLIVRILPLVLPAGSLSSLLSSVGPWTKDVLFLLALVAQSMMPMNTTEGGSSSSGGTGTGGTGTGTGATGTGTTNAPADTPPAPPAASSVRVLGGIGIFATMLAAVLALFGCNKATTIETNLAPAGECFVADIISGTVNFSDVGTAVLQLLAQCSGITAQDLVNLFQNLLTPQDAGAGDTGPSLGAPLEAGVALLSKNQVLALMLEAKKLPPTFGQKDAQAALAARQAPHP